MRAAWSRPPQLPDLESLAWYGYQVPNDRDDVRPEMSFSHRYLVRTQLNVPASLGGRGFFLDFQNFNLTASVFVNGRFCGFSKAHSTSLAVRHHAGRQAGRNQRPGRGLQRRLLRTEHEVRRRRGAGDGAAAILESAAKHDYAHVRRSAPGYAHRLGYAHRDPRAGDAGRGRTRVHHRRVLQTIGRGQAAGAGNHAAQPRRPGRDDASGKPGRAVQRRSGRRGREDVRHANRDHRQSRRQDNSTGRNLGQSNAVVARSAAPVLGHDDLEARRQSNRCQTYSRSVSASGNGTAICSRSTA